MLMINSYSFFIVVRNCMRVVHVQEIVVICVLLYFTFLLRGDNNNDKLNTRNKNNETLHNNSYSIVTELSVTYERKWLQTKDYYFLYFINFELYQLVVTEICLFIIFSSRFINEQLIRQVSKHISVGLMVMVFLT